MKKKPVVTILIIFVIIMTVYFIAWNLLTQKTKKALEVQISAARITYKTTKVSGFPFSKNFTISDLEFKNQLSNIEHNSLKIGKIKFSSFIFGNVYNISVADITTYNSLSKETNVLKFNSTPNINISFNKKGQLTSFIYADSGYKIIGAQNNEVYSLGSSNIKILSTIIEDTYDYAIKIDFNEMKNLALFEANQKKEPKIILIPDSYDCNIDLSLFLKEKNDIIIKSSIKINDFSFRNKTKNMHIALSGNIGADQEDPMLSGNLKIEINNFNNFAAMLLANLMQNPNLPEDPSLSASIVQSYQQNIKTLKELSQKHNETKNNKAVFVIERAKYATDYLINNTSLLNFLNEQQTQNQMQKQELIDQKQQIKNTQTPLLFEDETQNKFDIKNNESILDAKENDKIVPNNKKTPSNSKRSKVR
jgi:hypothetical protein